MSASRDRPAFPVFQATTGSRLGAGGARMDSGAQIGFCLFLDGDFNERVILEDFDDDGFAV